MKESEKKPWKQKETSCGLKECKLFDSCDKVQVEGNKKKCIKYKHPLR